MISSQEAKIILGAAEQLFSAAIVAQTVGRMAADITAELSDSYPLVLSIMGGAVVFTGQLLPLLEFPLNFDYLHLTRYNSSLHGGEINWKVTPTESVRDRVVLVLDDVLDEGITLAAVRDWVMSRGATACYTAVFAEKNTGKRKPISANFIGVVLPDRYAFGFGMDVHGAWRNLPAIYGLGNEC